MIYPAFEPSIQNNEQHSGFHHKICRSIDILALDLVLDDMVAAGMLDPNLAKIFRVQAEALLAAILSENNRAFYPPKPVTVEEKPNG